MRDLPTGPAWLFCPADRPERFAKAAAAADAVIVDLEDGVTAAARAAARISLAQSLEHLDPGRTIIRVNPVGTEDHRLDLLALSGLPFELVMLAKTESAAQVRSLGALAVVALCETPAGVMAAEEIAAAENCVAVMWGAEDLVAALGGTSSRHPSGAYREVARHARSHALLAAGAALTPAVDSVYLDIEDLEGLGAEATDAVASGFAAKACIHPKQVAVVRRAFLPTAVETAWAQRVVDAAQTSGVNGVFALDGQMVDAPLIRQAQRVLARSHPGP